MAPYFQHGSVDQQASRKSSTFHAAIPLSYPGTEPTLALLGENTAVITVETRGMGGVLLGLNQVPNSIFVGTLGTSHYPTGWSAVGDPAAEALVDPGTVNGIATYAVRIRETAAYGNQGITLGETTPTEPGAILIDSEGNILTDADGNVLTA